MILCHFTKEEKELGDLEDAATSPKTPTSKRKIYAPQFVLDC